MALNVLGAPLCRLVPSAAAESGVKNSRPGRLFPSRRAPPPTPSMDAPAHAAARVILCFLSSTDPRYPLVLSPHTPLRLRRMDADPAKPRRPPRRRRRLALSCLECRRRKVRCDRAEPCARCAATRAQCSYGPYGGGELPAAGDDDDDPAHARPQRLQQQQRPPAEALGGFVFGAGGDGSSTAVRAFGGGGTETELLQRVRRLEEASAAGCSSSSSEAMYASQNGLQEARVDLNKTRVVRWSLWMGRAPEVSSAGWVGGRGEGRPLSFGRLADDCTSSRILWRALERLVVLAVSAGPTGKKPGNWSCRWANCWINVRG